MQNRVPDCSECNAFEENASAQFVEEEICPNCPHSRVIENPVLLHLLHYMGLLEAGCPVGRHELTDREWILLGQIKSEQHKIIMAETKEQNDSITREVHFNGSQSKRGSQGSIFRRR